MPQGDLYFLGDIHGDFDWLAWAIDQEDIKNSTIIQVGDFGLGFLKNEDTKLYNLNRVCSTNKVLVYAIRGNHDNPAAFDSGDTYSNLKFLKDYSILNLHGQNILFVGGSISIDRTHRTENISYWNDEKFYFDDVKLDDCLRDIKKIDIVVTHSSPEGIYPFTLDLIVHAWMEIDKALHSDLMVDRNAHTKLLDHLISINLKPSHWYYGHFHKSRHTEYMDIGFKLLDINELHKHCAS